MTQDTRTIEVAWAYPTSSHARKAGLAREGAWIVKIASAPGEMGRYVAGYRERGAAMQYAVAERLPWAWHSERPNGEPYALIAIRDGANLAREIRATDIAALHARPGMQVSA